jgi:hypothetical protein
MFAADRVAMLCAVAELLKPRGVLAASVWATPERVPAISLAFRVIATVLKLDPPPPGPGPFTMADPRTAAAELRLAGFSEVEAHELTVPFRFGSVAEFSAFSRDLLPPGIQRLPAVGDPDIWEAVAAAAREYQGADGSLALPSVCICLRAVAGGER